ncbi:MAG TPA: DUF1015 domain-containing protein [Acidimicrobiales bacterium]|nr:DUF1015 domain-containing protein [Acidimicrobiales bacterium]
MPRLLPFRGLRPDPSIVGPLGGFVCPPYDVITEEQRLALLARSPYNYVRIELPAEDYSLAARLLAQWRAMGALNQDALPALYGYRMSFTTPAGARRETVGVLGALVLEPPGQGILPHEQTTPKAKSDRLELIRSVRANTSPIWCLSTVPGLAAALEEGRGGAVATDDDGTTHELWPIAAPGAHKAVQDIVGRAPLVVADGHHRYETALAYQAEHPPGAEGPSAVLALVVELSGEHLEVLAIHRLVSGLPPTADVVAAFESGFELVPTHAEGPQLLDAMASRGAIGVLTAQRTWLAHPLQRWPGPGPELDSSRVDAALERLPGHRLTYEHDMEAAASAVRQGLAEAAIFCRPATTGQIAATARGGARMPPKTTFFWPKPRSGMLLRAW